MGDEEAPSVPHFPKKLVIPNGLPGQEESHCQTSITTEGAPSFPRPLREGGAFRFKRKSSHKRCEANADANHIMKLGRRSPIHPAFPQKTCHSEWPSGQEESHCVPNPSRCRYRRLSPTTPTTPKKSGKGPTSNRAIDRPTTATRFSATGCGFRLRVHCCGSWLTLPGNPLLSDDFPQKH
jgi:hypothetical protein